MARAKSEIPTGEQPSIRFEINGDPDASKTKTAMGLKPFRSQQAMTLSAILSAWYMESTGTYSKGSEVDTTGPGEEVVVNAVEPLLCAIGMSKVPGTAVFTDESFSR